MAVSQVAQITALCKGDKSSSEATAETTGSKAVLSISPNAEAALPGTCLLLLSVLRHPHHTALLPRDKFQRQSHQTGSVKSSASLGGDIWVKKKKRICQNLGYIVLKPTKILRSGRCVVSDFRQEGLMAYQEMKVCQ